MSSWSFFCEQKFSVNCYNRKLGESLCLLCETLWYSFYSLNKKPNPSDFNILFSKAQKNLNCPEMKPKKTNKTW